jgi:chemotaxis protein CheY-P-specific phosphatase CheC
MTSQPFKIVEESGKTLHKVVQEALDTVATNLKSLMERDMALEPTTSTVMPVDEALGELKGEFIHLHGQFDKEMEGTVRLFVALPDAIAMSGFLRMLPDEVVASQRKEGGWGDDDEEAMKEVGNILFSALDEAFSDATTKNSNVRIDSIEKLKLSATNTLELEAEPYVISEFSCKIHEFTAQQAWLCIPLEAAEELNGSPLQFGENGLGGAGGIDDDIEDAPIRGELVAYSTDPAIQKRLRRACRRTGLRFEKRPRSEVPNPAAHHGKVVFIEIDRETPKRFEWCRRLKLADQDICVVLMLVRPNKMMVASAFKAKADSIIGWPIEEELLTEKLGGVFEDSRA